MRGRGEHVAQRGQVPEGKVRLGAVLFFLMIRRPPRSTLFSLHDALPISPPPSLGALAPPPPHPAAKATEKQIRMLDRKSTRLNSRHTITSYAVFCLKTTQLESTSDPLDTQVTPPVTPPARAPRT